MKKYFKYIMIIITSLFVIIGMNVKADDSDLCGNAKFKLTGNHKATICSLRGYVAPQDFQTKSVDSPSLYTINIYYTPTTGIWELEVKGDKKFSEIKEMSMKTITKTYSNGDYSFNASNFECPKSFNKILYKTHKNLLYKSYTISKIGFSKTATKVNSNLQVKGFKQTENGSTLLVDYPNDVKKYAKEKINAINKYECSDKKLNKLKTSINSECYFAELCWDARTEKKDECHSGASPLTDLMTAQQKKINNAIKEKIDSCDCSDYEKAKDKKNCENNVLDIERKVEIDNATTENIEEKVEEAVENFNFQRVVIDEEESTCEGILSKDGTEFLQKVLKFVQYGGVIVALLSSTLDFIKSVSSGSQDDLKKASSRFLKRMIFAALLFFVVILTNILLGIFNITVPSDCV